MRISCIPEIMPSMEFLTDDNVFNSLPSRKRQHSESSDDGASSPKSQSPLMDDDRRAHHNELERRRRDHIKDHFMALKEAIPILEGEKSSRALILKRAIEYISMMKTKISESQSGMAELKRRNELLEVKLNNQQVPSASPPQPFMAASPVTTPTATQSLGGFVLPTYRPTPVQPVTPPCLVDSLQLNGLIANSQDNLLALTQLLLSNSNLQQTNKFPSPLQTVPCMMTSQLLERPTAVQF